jgi:hypothetical protein
MLSDQGLLALVYFEADRACGGQTPWRQVALDTLAFVEAELTTPLGFASSLDADSDGEEGAHVTWTPDDVAQVLDRHGLLDHLGPTLERWRIASPGEFEGRSIPRLAATEPFATPSSLVPVHEALLAARRERPAPGRDDKVILEWNSYVLRAMLASGDAGYEQRALTRLLSLADTHHFDQRWSRTGQREVAATSADLASYALALEAAFEVTGEVAWLDRASTVLDELVARHWDGPEPTDDEPSRGAGLFVTHDRVSDLARRPKDFFEGATPSGHSLAAEAFARVALATGERRFERLARRLVELGGVVVSDHPRAVPDLIAAWSLLDNGIELVVPGAPGEMFALVRSFFVPHSLTVAGHSSVLCSEREDHVLYLCRHGACSLPARDADSALRQLREVAASWVSLRRSQHDTTARSIVRQLPQHERLELQPSGTTWGLVLGCTREDTTVIDLQSGASFAGAFRGAERAEPDLAIFDVAEAQLGPDLERDDLAQPEAVTLSDLPRQLGKLHGRRVRKMLERLQTPADGPLFGFRGPSAPYWEFRGERPSVALIVVDRGPQLLRRHDDQSTWIRFGWERDDVWLLCEDLHAIRALDAARRDSPRQGVGDRAGVSPHYVLTTLSQPLDGHCYKLCTGLLPRS